MNFAKGSVVRATLDFLKEDGGSEVLRDVLSRMPTEQRAAIERAEATDEYPLPSVFAFWRVADQVLGATEPDWMERAGAHSIDSMGIQLYGGIVRKTSPIEFLTQRISLFRLFYHPGDMQVIEQAPGRAVLRLIDFEETDELFCRRQTGGLRRVLELAGGDDPVAKHVRCITEGDAFCEWEMRWNG